MSQAAVAQRYAQALFEIGLADGSLPAIVKDFRALADAWSASPELRSALANPLVSPAARAAIVADLCTRLGVVRASVNAAGLLSQRRRLAILPDLATELARLSDERAGIVRAFVSSAAPLADATQEQLRQKLEVRTGKKVVLEVAVDAALIAGLVVRIGDLVIDGSARTRLAQLQSQLTPRA